MRFTAGSTKHRFPVGSMRSFRGAHALISASPWGWVCPTYRMGMGWSESCTFPRTSWARRSVTSHGLDLFFQRTANFATCTPVLQPMVNPHTRSSIYRWFSWHFHMFHWFPWGFPYGLIPFSAASAMVPEWWSYWATEKSPGPRRVARQVLRGGGASGDPPSLEGPADGHGGGCPCELVPWRVLKGKA